MTENQKKWALAIAQSCTIGYAWFAFNLDVAVLVMLSLWANNIALAKTKEGAE